MYRSRVRVSRIVHVVILMNAGYFVDRHETEAEESSIHRPAIGPPCDRFSRHRIHRKVVAISRLKSENQVGRLCSLIHVE